MTQAAYTVDTVLTYRQWKVTLKTKMQKNR